MIMQYSGCGLRSGKVFQVPIYDRAREKDDLGSISDFERRYASFCFLKTSWNIPIRELHTIVGIPS